MIGLWANIFKAHPTAILDVVDNNLLNDHSSSDIGSLADHQIAISTCLMSTIELGLLCTKYSPKERIPMTDVAVRLQKIKAEYLSNW